MGVEVGHDGNVGVAEHLLDEFRMDALSQRDRGRVAEAKNTCGIRRTALWAPRLSCTFCGGDDETRTHDFLLANQNPGILTGSHRYVFVVLSSALFRGRCGSGAALRGPL
jgi:hypothetical protein